MRQLFLAPPPKYFAKVSSDMRTVICQLRSLEDAILDPFLQRSTDRNLAYSLWGNNMFHPVVPQIIMSHKKDPDPGMSMCYLVNG